MFFVAHISFIFIEGKDYRLHYLEVFKGKLVIGNILAGCFKDHYVSNPLLTAEQALVNSLLLWNWQKENKQKNHFPQIIIRLWRNEYSNTVENKKGTYLDFLISKDFSGGNTNKNLRHETAAI